MPRAAGRIGWLLVWAVVFCDIGTSVYYVPGILYGTTGDRAGIFVTLTMVAFVFLAAKYVDVTRRFSNGGGVVSVADHALGPWWGCLGGQLIMVDYFLTVAISAMSGVYYLEALVPFPGLEVPVVLACLAALAMLNVVGIKESATVSLALAGAALLVDLVVIGATVASMPAGVLAEVAAQAWSLGSMAPTTLLVGYSGAWLAFSGLESISQLSPAMRDVNETPRRGMIAVVASVLITAPVLTFLSVLTLPPEVKSTETERFISELGLVWGGMGLKAAVVLTASALLLFAANTAIIGNYHVQLALSRRSFLPEAVGALSHRFQTPVRAIVFSTAVPAVVVLVAGGDMTLLGELYAFGLLGAFVLTSLGLDVLRWREGERGAGFWVGVFTTALVVLAFGVNLFAKPMATAFGGGLTAAGMLVALGTRTGWIERQLGRLPGMAPPVVPGEAARGFHTLAQVRTMVGPDDPANILVASRGAAEAIFRDACDRARTRGLTRVFLVYVDEVPGLFYPQLAAPTPEGLTVLGAGCERIRALGIEPVPVWVLSHGAAEAVAECAEACKADTVVIGATQRTLLWQALRGKFIQNLLAQLPTEIRLIVVG